MSTMLMFVVPLKRELWRIRHCIKSGMKSKENNLATCCWKMFSYFNSSSMNTVMYAVKFNIREFFNIITFFSILFHFISLYY